MRRALTALASVALVALLAAPGPFRPPVGGPFSGGPFRDGPFAQPGMGGAEAAPTVTISTPSADPHYVSSSDAYTVSGTTAGSVTSVAYAGSGTGACSTGAGTFSCSVTPIAGAATVTVTATGPGGTGQDTVGVRAPTFLLDVATRGSGIERTSDSITVDGTTLVADVSCNFKDVSGTTLTCDTGGAFPEASTGTSPSAVRAPVTGSDNEARSFTGSGTVYQSSSTSVGDLATEDFIVEAVYHSGTTGWIADKGSTAGWSLRQDFGSGGRLYLKSSIIVTFTSVQSAWHHVICFVNRDWNNASGAACYTNGAASGTGNASTLSASATSANALTVGAQSNLTSKFNGSVALLRTWKCSGCLADNTTDKAAVAKERFAAYAGLLPELAAGTNEPSTMTRATTAHLDIHNGTAAQLFLVGSGWPRVARRADSGATYRVGFLSEPQATNLLTQSQTFETSWGNVNSTESVNVIAAPDGTTTADGLIATAANNDHGFSHTATLTATTYTLSVYAKKGAQPSVLLYNQTLALGWCFNINTGASIGSHAGAAGVTGDIVSMGDGWYRTSITFTGTAAAHTLRLYASDDPDSCATNDANFLGDGATIDTYFWGAQVEAQPTATSYIPTTTASVTRNADDLRYSAASNFATAAGTIESSFMQPSFDVLSDSFILTIDSGATSDRHVHYVALSGDAATFFGATGGSTIYNIGPAGDVADGAHYTLRTTYATNDFVFYKGGVSAGTDNSGTPSSSITLIKVGENTGATNQVNGIVTRVLLRNEACTPAVCP